MEPWLDQEDNAAPYVLLHGDLWFLNQSTGGAGRYVADANQLVAVAFDSDGILHKHGAATQVEAWADTLRAVFAGSEEAQKIQVVSFPVTPETVSLLNYTIARTGAVLKFTERLGSIGASYPAHPALSYPR